MAILFENNTDFNMNKNYLEIIQKTVNETIIHEKCPYPVEVSITLVNNSEIKELNKEYMGKDTPTDVLSFPQIDFRVPSNFEFNLNELEDNYFNLETDELLIGDIVISVDKLIEQADEYGHSIERELGFLVVHSMLHLFGYDHIESDEEKQMFEIQEKILNKVGLSR